MRTYYLHGFGSGPGSVKARWCLDGCAAYGEPVEALDLNRPTFETQSVSGLLDWIGALDEARGPGAPPLRLIGSSYGGYLSARYAELHPSRVERLLLLCPAFDMHARWPLIIGRDGRAEWEREGTRVIPDAAGRVHRMPWSFVVDAESHPPYPIVNGPVTILHGERDSIVPIEYSHRFLEKVPHARLVEVDDDHSLRGSKDEFLRLLAAVFAPPAA
ncbi:MAG: alpha/beta fold hydrolase [Planctomycetota bacterium]|nr:alpha/beta fold hydrolase [Planctomycetota bacterium]